MLGNMDDISLVPDIEHEEPTTDNAPEEDIQFIGMHPRAVDFTAKADIKNIAMLKNIISEQNQGREIYNIRPIPFINQVRYDLVDYTKIKYDTPRLSLCEYLSTLFVVFVGG